MLGRHRFAGALSGKQRKHGARAWRWPLVAVALLLVPFCIRFVDRPLADLLGRPTRGLALVAIAPRLLLVMAIMAPFLPAILSGGRGKRTVGLVSLSVLWTAVVVELVLKRLAGRLGPVSWLEHG
ncbi:MAG: hypothetical protein ACREFW_04890 [Rhizomicrobium sp.]